MLAQTCVDTFSKCVGKNGTPGKNLDTNVTPSKCGSFFNSLFIEIVQTVQAAQCNITNGTRETILDTNGTNGAKSAGTKTGQHIFVLVQKSALSISITRVAPLFPFRVPFKGLWPPLPRPTAVLLVHFSPNV